MNTLVTDSADALSTLSHAANGAETAQSGQTKTHDSPMRLTRPFNGVGLVLSSLSEVCDEVLDTWDKCRFVRQGWFTAQEAVTYIDLYNYPINLSFLLDS